VNLEASSRTRERVVLSVLAAVQFTSIVDFMVIMPLGPQLMGSLDISPSQYGLVVSSYTLSAGIAGLLASAVVDRFGRKATFLVLYAGFLVGTLLCGLAPSYGTLVGARLAPGAFGGLLGGMAMAIIGDVFPDERRGRATGALMSGFSLASVAGVPFGLYLGNRLGWHAPFLSLVALGFPVLLIAALTLPPLRDHVGHSPPVHPLRSLFETFSHPNHLNAFAFVVMLMFGGFAVFTYIALYLVANVGLTDSQLPLIYIAGGIVTIFTAPLSGRLADRYGKLRVFRIVAPVSALVMLAVTNLPPVHVAVAVATVAALMVTNSGRMVAAMAMVTASVAPHQRGGFMSANSSVQHLAAGLGAFVAGQIIAESPDGRVEHFGLVGLTGVTATLLSIWLAGRLRPAGPMPAMSAVRSVAAAAEATCDVGEPLLETE